MRIGNNTQERCISWDQLIIICYQWKWNVDKSWFQPEQGCSHQFLHSLQVRHKSLRNGTQVQSCKLCPADNFKKDGRLVFLVNEVSMPNRVLDCRAPKHLLQIAYELQKWAHLLPVYISIAIGHEIHTSGAAQRLPTQGLSILIIMNFLITCFVNVYDTTAVPAY